MTWKSSKNKVFRCYRLKIMEDWATQKKMQEAQHLSNYQNLNEREALEKQIQKEKEAQRYTSFKKWVKKQQTLEEKENLLKMLE